jgi:hypothetical protein
MRGSICANLLKNKYTWLQQLSVCTRHYPIDKEWLPI